MENLIKEMIEKAYTDHDYELAGLTYKLMETLSITVNCSSNWRSIGEELAEHYKDCDWILDNCKLYEFE